ncbi:MAG TPA: sulfotransferase family protein, partial [Gammaproteobacteria bacterium]
RALYPRVPVLLLIRDPVEVLASHQRLAGRHMAGDPSLAGLNPAFAGLKADESPLDYRIRVLQALLEIMNGICEQPGVMTLDYSQLDAKKIRAIGNHFGITLSHDDDTRIQQRMKFHSKELHRAFQPDSRQKQQQLGMPERDRIRKDLASSYRRLLTFTLAPINEAVAC